MLNFIHCSICDYIFSLQVRYLDSSISNIHQRLLRNRKMKLTDHVLIKVCVAFRRKPPTIFYPQENSDKYKKDI